MLPSMIIFFVFHQNCIDQWNFIISIICHFANHLKIHFRIDARASLSDWLRWYDECGADLSMMPNLKVFNISSDNTARPCKFWIQFNIESFYYLPTIFPNCIIGWILFDTIGCQLKCSLLLVRLYFSVKNGPSFMDHKLMKTVVLDQFPEKVRLFR